MTLSRFSGQYRAVSFNYGGNVLENPDALEVVAAGGVTGVDTQTVQNGWTAASLMVRFSRHSTRTRRSAWSMRLALTPRLRSAVSTYVQSALYGPTATVTATWTNAHYAGDRVSSGTVGLQEAINFADSKGGGTVIVDADWTTQGGTTAILNAATLPANGTVQIMDNRGGSGATQQTLTVLVPNAQVLTLQSVGVPIVVVPAPGRWQS